MSSSPTPKRSSAGGTDTLVEAPAGHVTANESPVLERPLNQPQASADVRPMKSAPLAEYCTAILSSPHFAGVPIAFPARPNPQQVWLMNELTRSGAHVSQGCADSFRPMIVVDSDAEVTLNLYRHKERFANNLRGVIECTGEGARKFKKLESNAAIPVPVYSLSTAKVLNSTAVQRALAQATVQQVARLCGSATNKLKIAVAGYSGLGHIIADYARHQGARTFVIDTDPLHSIDAHTVGHQVGRAEALLPQADVVIITDPVERYSVLKHREHVDPEALIADVAGPGLDVALREVATKVESTRVGYTVYTVDDRLYRVANELNTKSPRAAVETQELEIAVTVSLMHDMLIRPLGTRKVHRVPDHIDQAIASAQLQALGIQIDTLS